MKIFSLLLIIGIGFQLHSCKKNEASVVPANDKISKQTIKPNPSKTSAYWRDLQQYLDIDKIKLRKIRRVKATYKKELRRMRREKTLTKSTRRELRLNQKTSLIKILGHNKYQALLAFEKKQASTTTNESN